MAYKLNNLSKEFQNKINKKTQSDVSKQNAEIDRMLKVFQATQNDIKKLKADHKKAERENHQLQRQNEKLQRQLENQANKQQEKADKEREREVRIQERDKQRQEREAQKIAKAEETKSIKAELEKIKAENKERDRIAKQQEKEIREREKSAKSLAKEHAKDYKTKQEKLGIINENRSVLEPYFTQKGQSIADASDDMLIEAYDNTMAKHKNMQGANRLAKAVEGVYGVSDDESKGGTGRAVREKEKNEREQNRQIRFNVNGLKDLVGQFGTLGETIASLIRPLNLFGAMLASFLFLKGVNARNEEKKNTDLSGMKAGLSPESQRGMRRLATIVGADGDGIISDYNAWATKMESAWATGNDPFTEGQRIALFGQGDKNLGLDNELFNKLSPQDQIQYIVDSLMAIEDQDKFNQVYSTLMNEGLPSNVLDLAYKSRIANIKDPMGKAKEFALEAETPQNLLGNRLEFSNNWQDITNRWENITLKFENAILQGLVPILEKIGDFAFLGTDREKVKTGQTLVDGLKNKSIDLNSTQGKKDFFSLIDTMNGNVVKTFTMTSARNQLVDMMASGDAKKANMASQVIGEMIRIDPKNAEAFADRAIQYDYDAMNPAFRNILGKGYKNKQSFEILEPLLEHYNNLKPQPQSGNYQLNGGINAGQHAGANYVSRDVANQAGVNVLMNDGSYSMGNPPQKGDTNITIIDKTNRGIDVQQNLSNVNAVSKTN